MRSLKLALLAMAATGALSSAGFAADLIVDTPAPEAPVVDNSFNWDGAYIGAFLADDFGGNDFGIGADLGVNMVTGPILIGGQVEGTYYFDNEWSAQATARVGGLITDGVLLYAFTGIGTQSTTDAYVPLGAGVEFGISDGISLKAEYQHQFDFDGSAEDSDVVKVGLNFHF